MLAKTPSVTMPPSTAANSWCPSAASTWMPAVERCRNTRQLAVAVGLWNSLAQSRYRAIGVALARLGVGRPAPGLGHAWWSRFRVECCSLPTRRGRRPVRNTMRSAPPGTARAWSPSGGAAVARWRSVSFASAAANSRSPGWAAHPAAVACSLAYEYGLAPSASRAARPSARMSRMRCRPATDHQRHIGKLGRR